MKVIELGPSGPTLDEVIGLAEAGPVVLRRPDGSLFALAHVDDFEVEADLLRDNAEFMAFLKRLAQEDATISIEDLRKELAL